MAMSKASMAARIISNIEARNTSLDGANKTLLIPYIQDICDGIIEEIKAEMEIVTQVQTPGVQSGSSTVTGTGQQVSIS